jgi:hypothetical protein
LSHLNTHWVCSPYPLYGSNGTPVTPVEKVEKQSVDGFRLLLLRKMAATFKQVWMNLLNLLHGVADLLPTVLFVPDPFGRLLCSSVRNAGICSSSNFCQRVQVNRKATTAQHAWVYSSRALFDRCRAIQTDNKPRPFSLADV